MHKSGVARNHFFCISFFFNFTFYQIFVFRFFSISLKKKRKKFFKFREIEKSFLNFVKMKKVFQILQFLRVHSISSVFFHDQVFRRKISKNNFHPVFRRNSKWFFVGSKMVFRRFRNGFSSVRKWFFVGSEMVFRRFFTDFIISSKISNKG